MKSVRTFGFSGGNIKTNFEIKTHAGLYYLYKDEILKAKADNQKVLDSYIDGWVKGIEDGFGDGYQSRKDFEEKKKAKVVNT